jgi:hypothetical protein
MRMRPFRMSGTRRIARVITRSLFYNWFKH